MFNKILVPLDGSALAALVLPHAEALAQKSRAAVVLFRAYHEPEDSAQLSHARESAQRYLAMLADRFVRAGIPIQVATGQGDAAEAILATADALQVDLIVMSTHGHTGVLRYVLGSVADQVLRETHIPILLVRPVVEDATAVAQPSMTQSQVVLS
jgi:nucleotide-binding universal stress UspA family protein